MRNFEYARPTTEAEAVSMLAEHDGRTTPLAGGTDLVTLLKRELVETERVVDLKHVEEWRGVTRAEDGGLLVGALTTLEDLADSPLAGDYPSLGHVAEGIRAIQMQQTGTVGGDLCLLPNCWYYRNGHGLLAMDRGESLVELGDNRYHAILGNGGPAKFVSASRFAPATIAWGAKVRVASTPAGRSGIEPESSNDPRSVGDASTPVTSRGASAEWLPVEYLYRTPTIASHGVTVLEPGQLITHVWLPPANGLVSASYEVLQGTGLDWPLAAAACTLDVSGGVIRDARVVLGHVAPTPWVSREAIRELVGHSVNEATFDRAADAAVAVATPLSGNGYKVQLARTAVKRALLRATGHDEGGL